MWTRGEPSSCEFALRVRSEGLGGRFDRRLLRELVSYTASAINLRVDAPGRKDGAEELEAADVHALMSESMGNIGKPDAKARGRKGRLDWEHSAVRDFGIWVCSLVMAILLDLAPMRATLGKCVARLDLAQGHTGYVYAIDMSRWQNRF